MCIVRNLTEAAFIFLWFFIVKVRSTTFAPVKVTFCMRIPTTTAWRRRPDDDLMTSQQLQLPDNDGLTTTAWRRPKDDGLTTAWWLPNNYDGLTTTAWRQWPDDDGLTKTAWRRLNDFQTTTTTWRWLPDNGLFKVNLEFSFSFPGFSFSGLDLVFKSGFQTWDSLHIAIADC